MRDRFNEQYRGNRPPQGTDRGFIDRAGDEVRSWFGDDDAERRRQMDDREEDRYRARDRSSSTGGYYGRGDDRPYGSETRSAYQPGNRPNYEYGSSHRPEDPDRASYGSDSNTRYNWGAEGGRSYGQGYRQGQSFSGVGPKGYQRSDERIKEDVCDRLCQNSAVDASEIEVTVSSGEVSLSGTVFAREDKRRAEDLAEAVSGVREVHNNLRVSRGQDRNGNAAGPLGLHDVSFGGGRGGDGRSSAETGGAGQDAGQSRAGQSGGGTAERSHPGITGGGPSGATDISSTSSSQPGSPLGLSRDTEKTSTAGGRR